MPTKAGSAAQPTQGPKPQEQGAHLAGQPGRGVHAGAVRRARAQRQPGQGGKAHGGGGGGRMPARLLSEQNWGRAGGHHWAVSGEGAHQGLDSRSGSKAQSTGIPGVKVR